MERGAGRARRTRGRERFFFSLCRGRPIDSHRARAPRDTLFPAGALPSPWCVLDNDTPRPHMARTGGRALPRSLSLSSFVPSVSRPAPIRFRALSLSLSRRTPPPHPRLTAKPVGLPGHRPARYHPAGPARPGRPPPADRGPSRQCAAGRRRRCSLHHDIGRGRPGRGGRGGHAPVHQPRDRGGRGEKEEGEERGGGESRSARTLSPPARPTPRARLSLSQPLPRFLSDQNRAPARPPPGARRHQGPAHRPHRAGGGPGDQARLFEAR